MSQSRPGGRKPALASKSPVWIFQFNVNRIELILLFICSSFPFFTLSSYRFMLYHLMQASNGKDITLHVSANNPAMVCCVVFVLLFFASSCAAPNLFVVILGFSPSPPLFSSSPVSLSRYKEVTD